LAREAGTQVPPGKKKGLGVAPQAEARSHAVMVSTQLGGKFAER